ncbi:DUF1116 domain-containing protein [Paenibacillus beijingensis]|uniref:DUF1116 domain-containing protein n=1 Tax=Paenibacillus beijingensis TaxID=1126833 RepID=UPI000696019E|nr:DUF1116 domain-containing protein [Paenibacillus beijingensis]
MSTARQQISERLQAVKPRWVGILPAGQAVPELRGTIGHSGPPMKAEDMLTVHKHGLIDLLCYEGKVDPRDLSRLVELDGRERSEEMDRLINHSFLRSGISLRSNWEMNIVAPLVGMVSESMPVMIIEDERSKQVVYSPLNEGVGRTVRFGSLGLDVADRLHWMNGVLAPLLSEALQAAGSIELLPVCQEALLMGDELHMRSKAASLLLAAKLTPAILELDRPGEQKAGVIRFLQNNPLFFLNLSMCVSRLYLKVMEDIQEECLVTACAANGVEIGIQVSSKPGRWFTAPAPLPSGSGHGSGEVAGPVIGDSPVIEAFGWGGRITLLAPGLWPSFGLSGTREWLAASNRISLAAAAALPGVWVPNDFGNALTVGLVAKKAAHGHVPVRVNTARLSLDGRFLGVGSFDIPSHCFQAAIL